MNVQIRRLGIALLVMFGVLFAQLNNLQLRQAARLSNDPRNTRAIVIDFSRERGRILAADGTVLADSVPTDDTLKRLRRYPEGPLYSPVLGYFSFNFGSDGAEREFSAELAGRKVTINNLDDLLAATPQTNDVTLTIRPAVQKAAAAALGSRRGAVVAIEPRTGAVLAMVSYPTFDPNPLAAHDLKAVQRAWNGYQADPAKPMLPRPYRERYSPGSTFKVVTASAAVGSRPDLATKAYPPLRALKLRGTTRDLPNFGGETCGGQLPELLRVSCNTGFGQLGLDLGGPALRDEALSFGWGERPPLDLPAPAASTFPDLADLRTQPQIATSAIGQLDVTATPLQMALVSCAVANGGTIIEPHVLAQVTDSKGEVVRTAAAKAWKQPMTPADAARIKDMMVGVAQRGTATRAAIPGVAVAAKTGTAQTTGNNAHAWLTAFAPADDPKVAVAVIVESQPGVSEATGGTVAAPIAQAVLKAALG
ncbi:MAG: penicillin-binding transpeptidase domain-containing protein [Acidimicrobiales bacterium]